MAARSVRNAPCPHGTGRKVKVCCGACGLANGCDWPGRGEVRYERCQEPVSAGRRRDTGRLIEAPTPCPSPQSGEGVSRVSRL